MQGCGGSKPPPYGIYKVNGMQGFTKKQLSEMAGYTYRRLHEIDRELPEGKKLFVPMKDGKCDGAMFVQHWVEYNIAKGDEAGKSLEEIKAIHEEVKTQKTRLQVAVLEGSLVNIADVYKLWTDVCNTVQQNLLRLPSKVAGQLVMVGSSELIESIINEELRAIMNEISTCPVPSYAAEGKDEDEENSEE